MLLGYLDPGSGSIIVQAALGGAAGLAVLWKRVRYRGRPTPDQESKQETPEE